MKGIPWWGMELVFANSLGIELAQILSAIVSLYIHAQNALHYTNRYRNLCSAVYTLRPTQTMQSPLATFQKCFVCQIYSVDCDNDAEVEDFTGMISDTALTHGTVIIYTCSDMCSGTRTCFNGSWSGVIPACDGRFNVFV